jgi:glutamate-1-semialdehyde 2,1-aminomutase
MEHVAPAGAMYQAGTLSGNPVATAAGIATLEILARDGVWDSVAAQATKLVDGLNAAAQDAGIPFRAQSVGTMFGFFFSDAEVRTYDDARMADADRFVTFFGGMLERGIYLAPSAFESGFLSSAHTDADIQATVMAAREVMHSL